MLLEWAFVVIGLMIGFLMFVDLGNMFNCYLVVTQVAYEGAKNAASYPSLEARSATNLVPTTTEESECLTGGNAASGFPCGHFFIQQRIRYAWDIARQNTYWSSLISSTVLTTRYVGVGETGTEIDNTVQVTFSVNFAGFVFRGLPVTSSISGPYLM